jgi:hypothetical protein
MSQIIFNIYLLIRVPCQAMEIEMNYIFCPWTHNLGGDMPKETGHPAQAAGRGFRAKAVPGWTYADEERRKGMLGRSQSIGPGKESKRGGTGWEGTQRAV